MADDIAAVRQQLNIISTSFKQIGADLERVNGVANQATGASGGISKLDGLFGGLTTRLLGPVGLVAGLYQVSNALSRVAADSVQTQAFARNMGMAADNIKDFQLQMQMMGKSSEEAKAAIGSINGVLNNFNTYKEQSNLSQTMFGREGGAEFLNRLNSTKDRMGQINEILETYKKSDERQKRGLADIFTGGDVDALDRLVLKTDLLSKTFQANEADLRKYHAASVLFETNVSEAWKAVAGNAISALNDLTGGAETSRDTFKSIVDVVNSEVDSLFKTTKATMEEIKSIREFLEAPWENTKKGAKKFFDTDGFTIDHGEGGRSEDSKEDYMKGETGAHWQYKGKLPSMDLRRKRSDAGTSDATDFSGMRRVREVEEDQSKTLVDIRDTLQRIEEKNSGSSKGSGSGSGSGSGGGSGGGYGGYGSANSSGGGGLSASRGATGKNTAEFMKHAKDQLRKEGVPEANLDHAAALLAGQAHAESGINPNASHDGGTGFGIYGARDDPRNTGPDSQRRTGMLNWMKENGYEPNSLEGQSRYMAHEAMTGKRFGPSRNALMGASADTMGTGTQTLTRNFEAPAHDNSSVRLGHAQAALNGGIVPQPGSITGSTGLSFGGDVRERQGAVAGVRKGGLDPRLRQALDYASSKTGLTADVTSGGQRMHGAPGAVGSHRHDNGNAGDFNLRDKDGNIVSPNDPRALEFYRYSAQAGVTGGGHSYMSDPNKIHLDRVGSVYAGGPAFRMAIQQGQQQSDEFAAAARERMNPANSQWAGKVSASVDFKNVPPGVATHADTSGSPFEELRINKTRQNDVSGGNTGTPFTGVW